jgi:hypothetical protein
VVERIHRARVTHTVAPLSGAAAKECGPLRPGFMVRSVSGLLGEEDWMTKRLGGDRPTRSAASYVALLVLVMTAGCAGQPEMTDLWRDPSFTSGPMTNVLVVALRKDPVRRRMWEDAFAKELGARGVAATTSYQLYPGAPPDTQEVIEAVRGNGYDAIIVSLRLPNETTSTFVPGAVTRQPVMSQDYFGDFHTYWRDVQEPGHTEIDEIRRMQTDVWSTSGGGRLIWSGTLRTLDSVSGGAAETAVAEDIAPAMEKQGVVSRRKK